MADYSRYKTATLERMRAAAWEKYYAETMKPCGNLGDGMRLSKLPQNRKWEKAKEELRRYDIEDIIEWELIFCEYRNAAYRNYLWAASSALGAHDTDDGFIDFRSWLISRGKEVYMNALRDPDSLATVPYEGEDLNFEDFANIAQDIYEEKRFGTDESDDIDVIEHTNIIVAEFGKYKLNKATVEEIHAEIPQREDIQKNWNSRMFPKLFPAIYRTKAPKTIPELLRKSEDLVIAHVYKNDECEQFLFQGTPENIASFIGSRPFVDSIILTDVLDRPLLSTIGYFLGQCPDQKLREEIIEPLTAIQTGDAKAQSFFCPTMDEVDAYTEEDEDDDDF